MTKLGSIPNDDGCDHRRTLLVPDPLLDVPWAVTASGPEINLDGGDLGVGYLQAWVLHAFSSIARRGESGAVRGSPPAKRAGNHRVPEKLSRRKRW